MSEMAFFINAVLGLNYLKLALFQGPKGLLAPLKMAPFEPFQTCIKGKQYPVGY